MDSREQKRGVMDGNCPEGKRKKSTSRPVNYRPSASVDSVPLAFAPPTNADQEPLAFAPPPDYFLRYQASNIAVDTAGNRIHPLTGLVSADGLRDRPRSENLASGGKHMLEVHDTEPEIEYQINMEIEENTARQAQRQMRQFTSTFTELCTGFETSKKKNEELEKQVTDLKGQIQILKDKEAHWDEKKKEIERERDEAREEARKAVNKKRILEQKLVKTTEQYKSGFVSYLANGGESLGDYVNKLVTETLRNNRAPADVAEHDGGM